MSFASRIVRSPRAFDKSRGDEMREMYTGAVPELLELLEGTAGSSPYLHGLLTRETEWLLGALDKAPEKTISDLLASVPIFDLQQLPDGLRVTKRRVALLAALADLGGVWCLEEVTGALTDFADAAVDASLRALVKAEIERGKVPGATMDDADTAAGMAVLAMGKMGAGELNYSSDIDLICLFDETRYEPDDYGDVRAAFIRVTRRMAAMLSDLTAEGYVFRTDLRLRPDPSVTPVCLSMEAAERYYESVGRTWERAAHIKARACAGDIAAGEKYLERLRPFVWRKHLDFASIQDAHDMRLRIREHKGLHGPVLLPGHNMKLGAGGIREIEFFTQTRQIIAGGRDPELRTRSTVEGLTVLAKKGWVPDDVSKQLIDDYRAHREIEHRLQMINDAQTHDLPKTDEGFERLAALAGRDVDEMKADLQVRLDRVSQVTEGFFAPDDDAPIEQFDDPRNQETVQRWLTYPAMRSERATEIFNRLVPDILARLEVAAKPDEALAQFDRFLAGLPSGVQVFSMFEANPMLIDLIVDIAATSPELSGYLGRNSNVFDAVIGGDFFSDWPGVDGLSAKLKSVLDGVSDYEGKLDAARRWMKEVHFRIGVHHLRGLISAIEAGRQYANLADVIVQAIWPIVVHEFARKHGPMPGNGAVVIGMGSLGSQRLTAASDLDLIVVYDPAEVEASEGQRPLPSRTYYARLTQALVTALSAPMAEGRLFEVDMRLRPSGRKGPVATSLESFKSYQMNEAWTWEHLALTRARVVAGENDLSQTIEAFREQLLSLKGEPEKTVADVIDMRRRIAEAKPDVAKWEAKLGKGRMQDVELFAQSAALMAGNGVRDIPSQIEVAVQIGWISADEAATLARSYALMWQLQSGARLLTGEQLDLNASGQGGTNFILREVGMASVEDLSSELTSVSSAAGAVIDTALGRLPANA